MLDIPVLIAAIELGSSTNILAYVANPALFTRHVPALDAAEKRARASLACEIPDLPWSKFRLFKDTGDRSQYEAPYFERRKRLSDLEICLLAGRDTDGTLLLALEDLIWEICNEYTWSLPAHIGISNRPTGIELDLFSSETGFYLAEALHLFADKLDSRVVARCRAEIKRRILDSYLGNYSTCWWEAGKNNWGAVCAGSIGMAFLYEEKDPQRLKAALSRVLKTMDLFIGSFPEDGTCEEGYGYWNYGFGFYTVFAEAFLEYTGGKVNLFDFPKIHKIALFPQRVSLSQGRTVSFSDGSRFRSVEHSIMSCLNRHFGDLARCGGDIGKRSHAKPSHLIRNFAWTDPARVAETLPDKTEYFKDAQWLVLRQAPFAFAALFGNNGVSHNHNDIGSFLMVDGEQEGPMDLGSGEYTRQYFSGQRYEILCNGSQGHSVPIVGGKLQKAGAQYKATDVCLAEKDGKVIFSGDIAGAYGLEALSSLRRTFEVSPLEAKAKVVDAFAFSGDALPVTERFVGYAKAEVTAPGKVSFGAFTASFDPSLKAAVKTEKMSNHGGRTSTEVFILDIEVPAGTPSFTIEFKGGIGRLEQIPSP